MGENLISMWSRDQCSAERPREKNFISRLGFGIGLGLGLYDSGYWLGLGFGLLSLLIYAFASLLRRTKSSRAYDYGERAQDKGLGYC